MTNWITSFNNEDLIQPNGAIQLITGSFSQSAMTLGFQELNYETFEQANYVDLPTRLNLINGILDQVQANDTVYFQFPMYAGQRFSEDFMRQLMTLKTVKKVAIIVDVPPWMNATSYEGYDAQHDGWLDWLKRFDLLIVANQKEAQHLHRDGVRTPMLSMVMSDYLYNGPLRPKRFKKELHYATGRDVLGLTYHASTPLNIYSAVADKTVTDNPSLIWHGYQPSSQIMASLDGGFGIVTSDNILERFGAVFSYYTQFNNPTKLSFYLAAGLPLITMSKTPHAQLVKQRHLGLVVDNLNEIDDVLRDISATDYQRMLDAIVPWQRAVTSGFFIRRALLASMQVLHLGMTDKLITL